MHSSTSILAILLSTALVAPAYSRQHNFGRSAPKHHRRQAPAPLSDPSNLADRSLKVADGCTQFYNVPSGSICYGVSDMFGITLEQFYAYNPAVDSLCSNMYAEQAYCVAVSDSAPAASAASNVASETAEASSSSTPSPSSSPVNKAIAKADLASHNKQAAAQYAANPMPTLVAKKPTPTPSSTSPPAPSSTYTPPSSSYEAPAKPSSTPAAGALSGISSFLGTNTGIGSWFRANNAGDDTNGHSWCGRPYDNNTPGFAPDVTTMLNNFGGDYVAAGVAYCGLEAEFTNPANGMTTKLFIADGFDSKWVLTPGSVDIMTGAFPLLYGKQTDNKQDVVQGLQWKFTGNRNPDLTFKGYGH